MWCHSLTSHRLTLRRTNSEYNEKLITMNFSLRRVPKHLLPKKLEFLPENDLPRCPDFTEGLLSRLPDHYKRFYLEWQYGEKLPVHYEKDERRFKLDRWGLVKPVQNVPIPLKYPQESDQGIWGGEAVIQCVKMAKGKFSKYLDPVPKFWIPNLRKTVLYSEVLDKHYYTTVTQRTIQLLFQHHGFDTYLLENKPQDLNSQLAFRIKRTILLALAREEIEPEERKGEILKKYKKHAIPEEEAEWYGLSLREAMHKQLLVEEQQKKEVGPLKHKYRQAFLEELNQKKDQLMEKTQENESLWQRIRPK